MKICESESLVVLPSKSVGILSAMISPVFLEKVPF